MTQTLQSDSPQVSKAGLPPRSTRWMPTAPTTQARIIAPMIRTTWFRFQLRKTPSNDSRADADSGSKSRSRRFRRHIRDLGP